VSKNKGARLATSAQVQERKAQARFVGLHLRTRKGRTQNILASPNGRKDRIMKYRTLAEMKEAHPIFFDKGNKAHFGELKYHKQGDCLIVKAKDPYTNAPIVFKVYDFSESPVICVDTLDTLFQARTAANMIGEMGRAWYTEQRKHENAVMMQVLGPDPRRKV
jgi:hypothetical protein